MHTDGAGTGAAPRSHRLGGRGARRVPLRAALGLGLGGGLALALIQGDTGALQAAALDSGQCYGRILELCKTPGLSDEALDAELHALLAANPPGPDGFGPIACLAADLLERVHSGGAEATELAPAMEPIRSPERRTWTIWELADARLQSGHLADAEALARFGLEAHPAPMLEPRLWHVRAEAARLSGHWDRVQECLDGMERSTSLDARSALESGSQTLVAQNHEYRSRLLQARTQVLLDLGLLDLSGEPALAAVAEADASGLERARVAARLLLFERALAGGNAQEAAEIARAASADPGLSSAQAAFLFAQGMAEVERAREARALRAEVEAAASRTRAAFGAALAAGLAPAEALEAELGWGELERMLGRWAEARLHLARARAVAQALGRDAPADGAVQLAMLAWRVAREDAADAAVLGPARAELFAAHERFLEQWRSIPRRPGGVGFLHVAWRAQLVSEVIEAELSSDPGAAGKKRAFARLLEVQAMGTGARTSGRAPAGLEEIRSELLGPGRGLLVLLPARDRSHLFVLDSEGLDHRRLPSGRDALRARARKVTAALQQPGGRVESEALRALHDELLPLDVQKRLGSWSGAITTGFDLLCDLPFGILGGENGRSYAQRLALVSLPSASFGLELARRPKRSEAEGRDLVLVMASRPAPSLGLAPFRFGAPERGRLCQPFEDVAVLEDATFDRLLEQRSLFSSARVVHFLTHGAARPEREYSAALVLAPHGESPSYLGAEDVASLELGGLVILSACGSGRGPVRAGDDRLVHLGGAFLDAGARCVLLARFPVEYEATLALMARVHARLAAGDGPAEALRTARADSESVDELAAFHAAAFEVLGLGFEPLFGR